MHRSAYLAELLAVLRTNGLEVRLDVVGEERGSIGSELCVLYVKFVCDDANVFCIKSLGSADKHLTDRLTVLDVRSVSCCTAEDNDVKNLFHAIFKRGVDE